MPTYDFLCLNESCKNEFDEFQSMNDPYPPCPKCGCTEIKRLISQGSSVKVELYGQELMSKLRSDGLKLKKQAYKDEKLLANIVGEDKYQSNVKEFGG